MSAALARDTSPVLARADTAKSPPLAAAELRRRAPPPGGNPRRVDSCGRTDDWVSALAVPMSPPVATVPCLPAALCKVAPATGPSLQLFAAALPLLSLSSDAPAPAPAGHCSCCASFLLSMAACPKPRPHPHPQLALMRLVGSLGAELEPGAGLASADEGIRSEGSMDSTGVGVATQLTCSSLAHQVEYGNGN